MTKAVLTKKDSNGNIVKVKVLDVLPGKAQNIKHSLPAGRHTVDFTTDTGLKNYLKRKNRNFSVVIADEGEYPKHVGGGSYELSTGEVLKPQNGATSAKEHAGKVEPTLQ